MLLTMKTMDNGNKNNNKNPLKYLSTSRDKRQQKKSFRQLWQQLRPGRDGLCEGFEEANPRIFGRKYGVRQGGNSIEAYPLSLICLKNPSLELVKLVHQAYPSAISNMDSDNEKEPRILPLHYACRYGASLEVIEYLVKEYPNGIKQEDKNGDLPLHYACGTQLEWSDELEKKTNEEQAEKRGNELVSWRGPRLEVLKYLISVYPESVKLQNKNRWIPLHALCKFRPSLETTHYLLSRYPGGVKDRTIAGYIPEELLVMAHRSKRTSPPLDIMALLEFVEMNLQDPHRSDALPMSRFALEWEILHRELVQKLAQSAKNHQFIKSGIQAKDQLDLFLYKLRRQYPSLEALQIMENNEAMRKAQFLDKPAINLQIAKEYEDAEMIPLHSLERIQASENALENLEVLEQKVPLEQMLKMTKDKAKIEIQLLAEKEIHAEIGSEIGSDVLEDDIYLDAATTIATSVDNVEAATVRSSLQYTRQKTRRLLVDTNKRKKCQEKPSLERGVGFLGISL